jgi:ribonuclease T2
MSRARIANADAANSAVPTGNFDYYLFTLSWSPEYCHGHPNNPQCDGSHPGFVVHGLWPQLNNGQWPSACPSAPGRLSNPTQVLDIMPDRQLIQHEWFTHGTCSGLTANQYFGAIRKAYNSIKIPSSLVNPTRTQMHSATDIKQLFTDANPGMSSNDIAISCHNRYLSAVAFCLNKNLQPIACQAVRGCNANSIRIPAAR